jgi:hypothetical protein
VALNNRNETIADLMSHESKSPINFMRTKRRIPPGVVRTLSLRAYFRRIECEPRAGRVNNNIASLSHAAPKLCTNAPAAKRKCACIETNYGAVLCYLT